MVYARGHPANRITPFACDNKKIEDFCEKNKKFGQKTSLTWYHKNIEKTLCKIRLPSR
jgi:hypothetical protein